MTKTQAAAFRRRMWNWYTHNGRHQLPWRRTRNPYKVLVSELMLQQTQVSRVLPKYKTWCRRFPTTQSVARAKLAEVLTCWQGLGYNRRALNLHRLCMVVEDEYGGKLPAVVAELESLPGIGPYTARAVASFAYETPVAVVETNIRKVILHYFFQAKQRVTEQEIVRVAEQLLDRRRPREWNWALMDYGALQRAGFGAVNPNRRAAAYRRQSPYQGSMRQLRAAVMKCVLTRRVVDQAALKRYLSLRRSSVLQIKKLPSILRQLVIEGFLEKTKTQYRVPLNGLHHYE